MKNFYQDLLISLPKSTGDQRKKWAEHIVLERIDMKKIAPLMKEEHPISSRFLWLLSDVGLSDASTLFKALPYLFSYCLENNPAQLHAFASYWSYVGVPEENEATAIDCLFTWLLSPTINTSIKSRAMLVLMQLVSKYPELKNELIASLKSQQNRYSADFEKRITKFLHELEK
jgi:hypothetical protein